MTDKVALGRQGELSSDALMQCEKLSSDALMQCEKLSSAGVRNKFFNAR